MNENKLTLEQIENWRTILIGIVGPYALLMTAEEIQKFHDGMQQYIDNEKEK